MELFKGLLGGAGAAGAGLGTGGLSASPNQGYAGSPGLPPAAGSPAAAGIPSVGGTGAGTGAGIGPLRPTTATPSLGEQLNMGDILGGSAGLGTSMGGPAAPLGTGIPYTPGAPATFGSGGAPSGGGGTALSSFWSSPFGQYLRYRHGLGGAGLPQLLQLLLSHPGTSARSLPVTSGLPGLG